MVRAFKSVGKGSRPKSGRLFARIPTAAPLRSPHQPVRVRLRHCPGVSVSTNLMHITRTSVDIPDLSDTAKFCQALLLKRYSLARPQTGKTRESKTVINL